MSAEKNTIFWSRKRIVSFWPAKTASDFGRGIKKDMLSSRAKARECLQKATSAFGRKGTSAFGRVIKKDILSSRTIASEGLHQS